MTRADELRQVADTFDEALEGFTPGADEMLAAVRDYAALLDWVYSVPPNPVLVQSLLGVYWPLVQLARVIADDENPIELFASELRQQAREVLARLDKVDA